MPNDDLNLDNLNLPDIGEELQAAPENVPPIQGAGESGLAALGKAVKKVPPKDAHIEEPPPARSGPVTLSPVNTMNTTKGPMAEVPAPAMQEVKSLSAIPGVLATPIVQDAIQPVEIDRMQKVRVRAIRTIITKGLITIGPWKWVNEVGYDFTEGRTYVVPYYIAQNLESLRFAIMVDGR